MFWVILLYIRFYLATVSVEGDSMMQWYVVLCHSKKIVIFPLSPASLQFLKISIDFLSSVQSGNGYSVAVLLYIKRKSRLLYSCFTLSAQ